MKVPTRKAALRQRAMTPTGHLLLAATVVLALASPLRPLSPATALSATASVDPRLRLDWEAGTRRGRPVVQGYVYNDSLRAANNVRLLVEVLDASGAVTARTVGFVFGVVPFNDRTYFEVPLKTPGASYRVSVTGFDWLSNGAGGGGGGGGGM